VLDLKRARSLPLLSASSAQLFNARLREQLLAWERDTHVRGDVKRYKRLAIGRYIVSRRFERVL